MAINLEATPANVNVTSPAHIYALTAPELQSKTVLLNGRPLALGPGDTVPELVPAKVHGDRVPLAAHSVNFITLPQARNPNCTSVL
jgi:heparanase